ncbi:hypothetical protein OS493_005028 [Desmophyllum pertusum]|uniref:Regulatory protein SIR2 homolog 7 n=1 Tax=Desmophyllum pertusum TaxID=174260 RepID=A0A9W9Z3V0_9CNID|nr:hypothetical protein OS493_005028 [Desmophyllum pertusum]
MHFNKKLSISDADPLLADIELGFHGHYGEPNMSFSDSITCLGKTVFSANCVIMATSSTPKKASSGSAPMASMFAKAQKNQRDLQDEYKNAPVVKGKSPVKNEVKPDIKSKGKLPSTSTKPPRDTTASKPRADNNISRISTSTGIADFRSGMNTVLPTGPGVWERKAHGVTLPSKQKKAETVLNAVPSPSHMAIVKLQQEGLVKFVVSQNTDGLHLRSGLDPNCLAELHGNTYLEKCVKCGKKYMRDFRTRTARQVHNHLTGRHCDNPQCAGPLIDSIINFNEDLPEEELDKAFDNSKVADLCLVLGSSLRVYPAADIPGDMIKRGAKVVIVNLQKTPLNKRCAMEVHATIDAVVSGLMKSLFTSPDTTASMVG